MTYNELKKLSDEIVRLYNKVALEKNIKIYNYSAPHKTNFSNSDKVISIMGINPSVEKRKREINYNENYEEDNFIQCNKNNLDLYYVPKNNDFDQEFNQKLKEYTCNFANKPYTQICGKDNLPFRKLLKMPWQKYDKKFIKDNYGNEKLKEYIELINKIKSKYDENLFEDKYLVFTNLIYVADNKQKNIAKVIEDKKYLAEFSNLINTLLNKQLEYYNIQLLIVANSYASKYLRTYILSEEKNWEKSDNSIHAYKNKKTNKIIYLTARYFDRMDVFSKELFYEDLGKIIN